MRFKKLPCIFRSNQLERSVQIGVLEWDNVRGSSDRAELRNIAVKLFVDHYELLAAFQRVKVKNKLNTLRPVTVGCLRG